MSKKGLNLMIGERVRQARVRRGYTQEALAKRLGVKQSIISRIENGQVALSFSSMYKISRLTGTVPSHFMP